jgi:hypothetical protein
MLIVLETAVTQHRVRLELAEEDAVALARDDALAIHDDISPAMLITSGIDLEAQQ